MKHSKQTCQQPAVSCAVTRGPAHHFFGYYDKYQVDATGTRLLTMETDFMDRPPAGTDTARIGLIHLDRDNRLETVAETRAWCWQQACMLQWLPGADDRKIIFNTRAGDGFGCCVLDLATGQQRCYTRPVYSVSSDGAFAVAPNFARLADMRPGYGYAGIPDPWRDVPAPDDDGIYHLDLVTGQSRLIISVAQIAGLNPPPTARGAKHWFNHLLISPDNKRFIFLNRWRIPSGGHLTRMFTANVDGSGIFCVNDHDLISHFNWRDARTIVTWSRRFDRGDHYYLFKDRTNELEIIGAGQLRQDGHMSYRPQNDWLLTDTYPDARHDRHLLLYNAQDDRLVDLGGFYSPPGVAGEIRCDLHPRWSRDGRSVTFDSVHEGSRQIYRLDVGKIVEPGQGAG